MLEIKFLWKGMEWVWRREVARPFAYIVFFNDFLIDSGMREVEVISVRYYRSGRWKPCIIVGNRDGLNCCIVDNTSNILGLYGLKIEAGTTWNTTFLSKEQKRQEKLRELAEVMKAYVEGEEVEVEGDFGWEALKKDDNQPLFSSDFNYRVNPKNTTKVNWDQIEEKWKWAATGSTGGIYLFSEAPTWHSRGDGGFYYTSNDTQVYFSPPQLEALGWKSDKANIFNSLLERP